VTRAAPLRDLDLSGENDGQAMTGLPRALQGLAVPIGRQDAETSQSVDFRRRKRREHLVTPRLQQVSRQSGPRLAEQVVTLAPGRFDFG
jgi:hypothetical protein